jgi:hypothetical protein
MLHRLSLLLTGWVLLAGPVAVAQEPELYEAEVDAGNEHGEYHENLIAFLVGVAHQGPRDNGLALGVEYEHRLSSDFGIGALAEHTFGDFDAWVYAVPFAYHRGPWKVYAAPGIEDGERGSESMLRLGGEYGLEVGEWEIAPQLDLDLIGGEQTWVFGLTFGKGL